ncbi:HYR domain-containing protein, partial [Pyxidicoccus fallax]
TYPRPGVELDGKLYFVAEPNAYAGDILFRSDGTSAGTVAVGGTTSLRQPTHLTRLGGRLLVAASDNDTGARALWSVDPSAEAPRVLAPVRLWTDDPERPIVTAGTEAWFIYPEDAEGESLWKTDGTPEGTRRVRGLRSIRWRPRLPVVLGTRLYFAAASSAWSGEELWTSDGTDAGTRKLVALDAPEAFVSFYDMVTMNGRLYFWASTDALGIQLWTSDGTAAGTRALGPVPSESGTELRQRNTAIVNGTLFFPVHPAGRAPELWKSDGGAPVRVRTFGTSARVGPPIHLTAAGDTLLFVADDGTHGYQPWRSDGTAEGTGMLKNLRPDGGPAAGSPGDFFPLGTDGTFVFAASDGLSGQELWRTDGTAAGTVRVADIAPGVASSSPLWMVPAGEHLFFPAWSAGSGTELWAMRLEEADMEAPVLTCPGPQVVEAVSAQGAPVSYPLARVTDDKDPNPKVTYSHASGAVFMLGVTDASVTATDAAGNATMCQFAVHVRDTTAPALECPPSQSAVATSSAGVAVVWPEAQASDAVSRPVTVTYAPARGSVFPVGTTEVTATATDSSGNPRSCTFEVRVSGSDTPDGGGGTSPPPPEDSSGCGCQQSGGAGLGMFGLALLGLLSARRRRSVDTTAP